MQHYVCYASTEGKKIFLKNCYFIYIPLLSGFLISMVILSPTFIAISSYSLILILNVGESVSIPPPPIALDKFPIAFGKFFIMSSGEVNVIMFGPKGFCGFSAPGLYSLGSENVT